MVRAAIQNEALAALKELRDLKRCRTRWGKRRRAVIEDTENFDPSEALEVTRNPAVDKELKRDKNAHRVRKSFISAASSEKDRVQRRERRMQRNVRHTQWRKRAARKGRQRAGRKAGHRILDQGDLEDGRWPQLEAKKEREAAAMEAEAEGRRAMLLRDDRDRAAGKLPPKKARDSAQRATAAFEQDSLILERLFKRKDGVRGAPKHRQGERKMGLRPQLSRRSHRRFLRGSETFGELEPETAGHMRDFYSWQSAVLADDDPASGARGASVGGGHGKTAASVDGNDVSSRLTTQQTSGSGSPYAPPPSQRSTFSLPSLARASPAASTASAATPIAVGPPRSALRSRDSSSRAASRQSKRVSWSRELNSVAGEHSGIGSRPNLSRQSKRVSWSRELNSVAGEHSGIGSCPNISSPLLDSQAPQSVLQPSDSASGEDAVLGNDAPSAAAPPKTLGALVPPQSPLSSGGGGLVTQHQRPIWSRQSGEHPLRNMASLSLSQLPGTPMSSGLVGALPLAPPQEEDEEEDDEGSDASADARAAVPRLGGATPRFSRSPPEAEDGEGGVADGSGAHGKGARRRRRRRRRRGRLKKRRGGRPPRRSASGDVGGGDDGRHARRAASSAKHALDDATQPPQKGGGGERRRRRGGGGGVSALRALVGRDESAWQQELAAEDDEGGAGYGGAPGTSAAALLFGSAASAVGAHGDPFAHLAALGGSASVGALGAVPSATAVDADPEVAGVPVASRALRCSPHLCPSPLRHSRVRTEWDFCLRIVHPPHAAACRCPGRHRDSSPALTRRSRIEAPIPLGASNDRGYAGQGGGATRGRAEGEGGISAAPPPASSTARHASVEWARVLEFRRKLR